MLRPPQLLQQEALPEASRWRRRRSALRPRRRRSVSSFERFLSTERLGGTKAALAGRGRRGGGDGLVAQRERGHHRTPKPSREEHQIQHASQSASTQQFVVCSTPKSTALLLIGSRLRRLHTLRAAREWLLPLRHGALLLLLPRRLRLLLLLVMPCCH